jgi:hypothetical protein
MRKTEPPAAPNPQIPVVASGMVTWPDVHGVSTESLGALALQAVRAALEVEALGGSLETKIVPRTFPWCSLSSRCKEANPHFSS